MLLYPIRPVSFCPYLHVAHCSASDDVSTSSCAPGWNQCDEYKLTLKLNTIHTIWICYCSLLWCLLMSILTMLAQLSVLLLLINFITISLTTSLT